MNWALDNREIVLDTLVQHLWLTLPPIVLSLALTVPIAWLVHRSARLATPVVTASALLYTIPSLPLLIMIPVLIGTGLRSPINVVIALTLYGLALLVPVAVPAVRDTSQPVVHVAAAIGFTRSRRFWSVQLPLAGPQLVAGLRVVSASTISLATLGAVLGISGLGRLFTDGFQRGIEAEIVTGIVLTVALALVMDALIVFLGWMTLPWTRPDRRRAR